MRWIVRILFVVAVAFGLAFSTLTLIPSDRIAALAALEFSRLTGRALHIEGDVSPTLWPVIGVRVGRVTVANADWSGQTPMMSAEGLAIGVDLSDLLGGSMRITDLALIRPLILLERSKDGQANWHIAPHQTTGRASRAGTPVVIEAASIVDGRIRYVDHATGHRLDLASVEMAADMPAPSGKAKVTLAARTGSTALDLSATFATPAALFGGGVGPATITASAGPARMSFAGRAGLFPFAADGTIDADLADLSAVAALAGFPPPALPDGWGANSVTLGGKLTVTPGGTAHLRGGTLRLDAREFTGDADLSRINGRMRVVAQLATGALTLAPAARAQDGSVWSDAPVTLATLGPIDATIGFRAGSLTLGPLRLGEVNGQFLLDRAHAELTLAEAAAYGGAMSGRLVADTRNGLSVAANVAFKGVAVQPLLSDLAGVGGLRSKGDLSVTLTGTGASVAEIMANLSGSGRLSLGAGAADGLNLAGVLATLDPARADGGATAFDSLTGSFTVTQGDLVTGDLALRGQLVRADGTGRIGLATRDFALRLQTRAMTGADGTGGQGIPVMLTGPWAAPRFGLDPVSPEPATRAAALNDPELQTGETAEDAAKRKLDEAIQRGIDEALQGLFDN